MPIWEPVVGQQITVVYCTPDEYLFRGILVRVTTQVQAGQPAIYSIEAVDATWLWARYPMEARFDNLGINTAIARILPAESRGHVPSSLGNVPEMRFSGTTMVSTALTRLSKVVGGYWRVKPHAETIDLFVPGSDEDGNRPVLTNSSTLRQLSFVTDATQLRRVTLVEGSGGTVVSPATVFSNSLTVTEVGWYGRFLTNSEDPSLTVTETGSYAQAMGMIEGNMIAFNPPGGSGQGTINSIVPIYNPAEYGLPNDVPHGAILRTLGYAFDPTSETRFDAYILVHAIQAWDLSGNAVASLAWADNAMYKTPLTSIRYTTDARWMRVGQYVCASITAPTSVVGTFVIQRMTTTPRVVTDSLVVFDKTVEAGPYLKDVSALLARLS